MEFKARIIDDEQASTYLHSSSNMSYFTDQALRAGYWSNDFGRTNFLFRNPSNVAEVIQRGIERERIREEIMAAEIARKRLLEEAELRRQMLMEREMALQRADGLLFLSPGLASSSTWFEPRLSILHPSEATRLLEERWALSLLERLSYSTRRECGGLETVPLKRKISEMVESRTSEIMPFQRARKKRKIVKRQGCLPQSLRDGFGTKASTERWLKHYSSSHKILLVGEGDFSFSTCLAKAFGSAHNMLATSLNSIGFLMKNYKKSMLNIDELEFRGCTVMHDIDATKMADHYVLRSLKFDRIVFNFPHAGFSTNESRQSQISKNQKLVMSFLDNAKKMVKDDGEIHISHKSNGFFLEWEIELFAILCGLRLKEEVAFNLNDYPGYNTKYGFGGDKNFDCNPSNTSKFVLRN